MGDIDHFLDRVEREEHETLDRINNLLQQFPRNEVLIQLLITRIFQSGSDLPEDALASFNLFLRVYRDPSAKHIYIQECTHVDPYRPLDRPAVRNGNIDYSDPEEFPLSDMTRRQKRILLPFCFEDTSWFLVELKLGPCPRNESTQRQARVAIYTNKRGCVKSTDATRRTVEVWVLELLEYASLLPSSPTWAVDWTKTVVEEVFIPQLMSLERLGAIIATLVVADEFKATILLNNTLWHGLPSIEREARVACIQVIEQFILLMNDQDSTWFDLPDKLLRAVDNSVFDPTATNRALNAIERTSKGFSRDHGVDLCRDLFGAPPTAALEEVNAAAVKEFSSKDSHPHRDNAQRYLEARENLVKANGKDKQALRDELKDLGTQLDAYFLGPWVDVVFPACSSASNDALTSFKAQVVTVDEAAQATVGDICMNKKWSTSIDADGEYQLFGNITFMVNDKKFPFVVDFVGAVTKSMPKDDGSSPTPEHITLGDIGILFPYKGQVRQIFRKLKGAGIHAK
ncbi:uncharacterized protein M421DRAFT_90447 [Didymella exigua CBS 183.55]|uniref:Uncharacterized protein n=1 Tax=Didymella exigua CBS 183.55 TaxID=1150837 RepID=A0A6A5RW42_9PLEO|nr:uncharacterized protein M421DRAFT_90447 [Didymella exigua CBS 183.55]KAF1931394.1 hypothetical protein M421DRAFT_90447 [Didymella exigua CBS 183.55]